MFKRSTLSALVALLLIVQSGGAMAEPRPAILRIHGFPLSLADFSDFRFPGNAPFKRKLSKDQRCSVGVAQAPDQGESNLTVGENLGGSKESYVNILHFRVEGPDFLVPGLGNAQTPGERQYMKYKITRAADASQTLRVDWQHGLFGEAASLTLSVTPKGNIFYARAETRTRDSHMLGWLATIILGRTVQRAECRFK